MYQSICITGSENQVTVRIKIMPLNFFILSNTQDGSSAKRRGLRDGEGRDGRGDR